MLSVNTNVNSLVTQTALSKTQAQLAQATERLSTGLRINSAKDDAAGLAVSQLMSAQVASLNQAVQNANDGVNMLQTADGAIANQQNIIQRMRTLAVEGSSSTIDNTSRSYINTELQQLMAGSNAIASSTKFNGQSLLTGSLSSTLAGGSTAKVGVSLATTSVATISNVDVAGAAGGHTFTFSKTGATSLTLTDGTTGAAQTITVGAIAANGSENLNFSQLGINLTVVSGAGKAAADIVTDIGTAGLTAVTAGNGAATFQIGADATAGNSFTVNMSNTQIDTVANGATVAMDALNTALSNFAGASTTTNASALLSAVDGALGSLNSARSTLGSAMNRLNNAATNTQNTSTNLATAASGITDANFAAETTNLTRANILQQAGTAMLAQANSQPNQVMSLLQKL